MPLRMSWWLFKLFPDTHYGDTGENPAIDQTGEATNDALCPRQYVTASSHYTDEITGDASDSVLFTDGGAFHLWLRSLKIYFNEVNVYISDVIVKTYFIALYNY